MLCLDLPECVCVHRLSARISCVDVKTLHARIFWGYHQDNGSSVGKQTRSVGFVEHFLGSWPGRKQGTLNPFNKRLCRKDHGIWSRRQQGTLNPVNKRL